MNPFRWQSSCEDVVIAAAATFRKNSGLRRILIDYLQYVEPDALTGVDDETRWTALATTFSSDRLAFLRRVGYDAVDVATWAWIFTSNNLDLAFARYLASVRDLRSSGGGRMPKFVVLQLLRGANVSAYALTETVKSLLADLQLCLDVGAYTGWNWTTRCCLAVRLVRHARRVAPESLVDISRIVKHLFFDYYAVHHRELEHPELRRLCHFYNRFLSLLALAPQKSPFNDYPSQQEAQLAILRLMFVFKPLIPLTREGYRALIIVQLLHHKTEPEREWGESKSLSWPPWRKIQLGIEQNREFPGKESRVIKVLGRMQEAGYRLGDWEQSAAILAGWDTDGSPTLQTRGILMRPRRPWLLSWPPRPPSQDQQHNSAQMSHATPIAAIVWASRIRATRTTREAWASFRSYERALASSEAYYRPYFAMMDKLLVATIGRGSRQEWKYLAGDVKETFEIPRNPRDLVYIDMDVPSPGEFYQRMLQAGIKPGGNLMATLLKHSSGLEAGFAYIEDSRWDRLIKDVLRNAQKYPRTTIRDCLNKLPIHTLAAFVALLCRTGLEPMPWFRNVGKVDPLTGKLYGRDNVPVFAMGYATQLLLAADVSDRRVWNALLQGTFVGVQKHLAQPSGATSKAWWRRLTKILSPDQSFLRLHPDLDTFRYEAKIHHLLLKRVDTPIPPAKLGSLAKETFVAAVYGRSLNMFLPSRRHCILAMPTLEDLHLLVRTLVSVHDRQGLVALVTWINIHGETLTSLERDRHAALQDDIGVTANDGKPRVPSRLHDLICAVRLFLDHSIDLLAGFLTIEDEQARFQSPFANTAENLAALGQVRIHCKGLRWPSDEDVAMFLSNNTVWVEVVRHAAEMTLLRRAGRRDQAMGEEITTST